MKMMREINLTKVDDMGFNDQCYILHNRQLSLFVMGFQSILIQPYCSYATLLSMHYRIVIIQSLILKDGLVKFHNGK